MAQFSISNSNGRYTLWLEVTETGTDVSSNTSALSYTLWLKANTGYHFSQYAIGYGVALNGQLVAYQSRGSAPQYSIAGNGTLTLATGTYTVKHNTDGSLNMPVAFSIDMASDANSPGPLRSEAVMTLTTIPRASSIGATDADIGAVSTITVSRKSSAYTHSVQFQFGGLSGYITASGGVSTSEVRISETSVPFSVPASFYSQIPNAKSGTCTLICRTYSGGTQIGDAKTTSFTAVASERACKPTVSGTVVDVNDATKALTGDANKLVRYMSTALCTISASAKNYASIVSKAISGTSVSGDTRTIPAVETGSFSFAVNDSRGYGNSATVAKTLIPYVNLTNNPTATRNGSVSGDAKLYLSGDYYNGSFGTVSNALTAKYRISGGSWVDVAPHVTGDTYALQIGLAGLDYQTAYNIEVSVSDKLAAITKSVILDAADPAFYWGKNDFWMNVMLHANGGAEAVLANHNLYASDYDNDERAFETWLNNKLSEMEESSVRDVAWLCYPAVTGTMTCSRLFKHGYGSCAALFGFSSSGQIFLKVKSNGTWHATKQLTL